MAWTPDSNYDAVNATLKADPRYTAALQAYQQALAANPLPSITQQRTEGGDASAETAARQVAKLAFAKTAHEILLSYGITDFDQLGFNPDSGVVAYEPPDHSLRNILIPMAAIATAGILSGALAGPEAGGLTVGGVEGGAYGVDAGALTSLGTGAMGAVPVAAPVVGGGTLASIGGGNAAVDVGAGATAPTGVGSSAVSATADPAAWDEAGNFIGSSTVSSVAPTSSTIGATIGKIANSSWFPVAIGTAGNLIGAKMASDASTEAANIQAQSAKDALDFAKSQAAIERQNFAPYLAAGTGALSKLSYGLGIGEPGDYNANGMPATPPGGSPGSLTPYGDPQVSPKSPAGQFITNTKTQPVWMVAPTGERAQVPANMVQQAIDKGAKIEPGQGMDGGSVPRTGSLALIGRTPPAGAEYVGSAVGR